MKKIMLFSILLLIFFLIFATVLDLNHPDSLPEGKNYIDSENLTVDERFIYIDKPFLIKGGTNYTFSIARNYVDGRPFELIINLYDDENFLYSITKDEYTMSFDYITNIYYLTFLTNENANYADIQIANNSGYELGDELVDVQLEEGDEYTDYEPYIESSFFDTWTFYLVFGSFVLIIVVAGILEFIFIMKSKNKDRKVKNLKAKK